MESGTMIKEMFINASPRAVFKMVTRPVQIVRWMAPQSKRSRLAFGAWKIDFNGRVIVRSRALKLKPDRKVMFAWGWVAPRQRFAVIDSVVVISLVSQGDGTRVHLIHRKLPRALAVQIGSRQERSR